MRFLAGYRRAWLFDRGVLEQLRTMDLDGAALGTVFRVLPKAPEAVLRSVVLHLLWQQHWQIDLTRPLSLGHVLRRVP